MRRATYQGSSVSASKFTSVGTLGQLIARVRDINEELLNGFMNEVALPKLIDFIYDEVYSYEATWTNGYDKFFAEDGRTYQFGEAWGVMQRRQGFFTQEEIAIDDAYLDWDDWSHNTRTGYGLAEIINNGNRVSNFGFPAMEARPYWNKFIDWWNRRFAYEYETYCKKKGVNMTVN